MKKAKKNYRNKCKRRTIDFYLHEEALYNFTKQICFSNFVKMCLRKAMEEKKGAKNG